MSRSLLIAVVLSFLAGQNALLACGASCDAAAVSSGCHHGGSQGTSPQIASDSHCPLVGTTAAAFEEEDGRRAPTAPSGENGIWASTPRLASSAITRDPGDNVGRLSGRLRRPLHTALRI